MTSQAQYGQEGSLQKKQKSGIRTEGLVQIFSIFGGGEHAGKVAVVMFL